ncbi:hypothetical protein GIV47_19395 [Pseudomonas marginalis]|uniref:hypothetical protein n=1 Tax=Pseudomonas marginalis TaxID=298 RepID=UPI001F307C99|nr:hypothetical protein [Pseudomonas marginalis]MCF5667125.1 hypothetical protein [Pseudomonas marginalis]
MQRIGKNAITPMALIGVALFCGNAATVNAATFISSGNAAGAQCETVGVNDNAQVVGNCSPFSVSANNNPWYAATPAGPQQILPPLVNRKPCRVEAITNSGWIVGSCSNATNRRFAVFWNTATPNSVPTKTAPLPGTLLFPLFRPADVQTLPTAVNQQGTVLAQSFNKSLLATVVLYTAGNATPRRVSSYGDNCSGVDVNNTLINGYPSIVMNCPGEDATPVPTIATWNGSAYVMTVLAVPPGASYCSAVGMNDQLKVLGTCFFNSSTDEVPQTAFWGTLTGLPDLLTMPLNAQNHAVAINNAGHYVAYGNDPSGVDKPLFVQDPTDSFSVQSIQPLPGSIQTTVAGFAGNDTIALNCIDANQHPCGGYWTSATGTAAVPQLPSGSISQLNGINPSGSIVYGTALNATEDNKAVTATLP